MCCPLCPRRRNITTDTTNDPQNSTKMSFWFKILQLNHHHHHHHHPNHNHPHWMIMMNKFGLWSMLFLKILSLLIIVDLLILHDQSTTFAAIITNKDRPYTSIIYTAVDGGKVALPCNIIPPTIDDHVVLILWYKDDDFEPIYTIDARKDPLEKARIISSPNLIDRVYFNQHNQPAFLQIDPVQTRDAGEYRCRVDFKKARTVNIVIQLKVIVPPEEPIISYKYSESTSHPLKGLIGPFNEGDRLVLVCTSFGGKPRPTLTWWKDYSIIDDSFEYRSQDVTVNELVIESLARHHLLSIFTCQSTNNNITIASSASITIDLNLKPLEVKIRQLSPSLLANQDAKFECTSFGSKPKARLYWMFNEIRFDTTLQGDMQTISIISLPLKREHNGHILSCHAENPKIHNSTIAEHFVLSVEYVPDLKLQLGISTISLQAIQEGNDIYFDCILDANPMPTTPIVWRFNDEILEPRSGIIQSNYSLVLQNVRRHMSGKYQCEATNKHGTTRSNSIDLAIRFAPYCKFKSTLAYGLSLFESNALVCEVDSNPMPTSFQWKFEKEIDLTSVRSHNFSSILYYRPNSTQHYGIIECMAKNDVGLQQVPCKYHIIDSGPPNFPFYCQLLNQSVDKITVRCTSEKLLMSNDVHQQYRIGSSNSEETGLDNGPRVHSKQQQPERSEPIAQTIFVHPTTNYVAEVYDKHGRMLRNITLNPPMPFTNVTNLDLINRTRTSSSSEAFNFQIDNLMESSVYKIKIYALNSKGTSDQMWISGQTLRKAEKYVYSNFTETGLLFSNYALSHIKIIMVSVCGLLTILLIVIVIAITYMSKYCQRLRRKSAKRKSANHRRSSSSLSLKFPNSGSLNPGNTNNNDDDDDDEQDIILNEMDINQQQHHHSVQHHHHHHLEDVHENGGYSLDNLAIPTVYTETNVICNEYYGNILASNSNSNSNSNHHHNNNNNNNNNNNGCYNGTNLKEMTKTTTTTVAAAANLELLSLDLYSMNSMDGSIGGGSGGICGATTLAPKGPPDLIPTFYYNNERVRDLMNNNNNSNNTINT